MRRFWIFLSVLIWGVGTGLGYYYWPRRLDTPHPSILQTINITDSGISVSVPNRALIGELGRFDDGLFAFLMFDYLRGRSLLADQTVLLTSSEQPNGTPIYRILVRLPDDLMRGIGFLAELKADKFAAEVRFDWVLPSRFVRYLQETSVFVKAYDGPTYERLRVLHAPELESYLRRFIRFKSETDPRIWSGSEAIPSPLTKSDAARLAADIIAVAHFYDLPIDLFLGIGAMENNYMNVAGDLQNAVWKHRPEQGDIVLKRRGSRVLVKNDSVGVWQITRESLRYAHRLYRKDKRDYTLLPERLRPPQKLDFDTVSPGVLTTYAALLLRDLLDRFHGDVSLAAGAYNGGPGNPNAHYASGVEMVANYARRVIGRAAQMDRVALGQSSVNSLKINETLRTLQKEAVSREKATH